MPADVIVPAVMAFRGARATRSFFWNNRPAEWSGCAPCWAGRAIAKLDPMERPYLDAAYLYASAGRAHLAREMVAARTRTLAVDSALGVLTPNREEHNYPAGQSRASHRGGGRAVSTTRWPPDGGDRRHLAAGTVGASRHRARARPGGTFRFRAGILRDAISPRPI